jgi:hypothetical protein
MSETNELIIEPIVANIKMDRKTYMREYKRKKYAENADLIKDKNKAYYYKSKFNLPSEDMKKYDVLLPIVYLIKNNLEELKKKNPDIFKEIIQEYSI